MNPWGTRREPLGNRTPGEVLGNPWRTLELLENPWEACGESLGHPWEPLGNSSGTHAGLLDNPWEILEKSVGNPWGFAGEPMGNHPGESLWEPLGNPWRTPSQFLGVYKRRRCNMHNSEADERTSYLVTHIFECMRGMPDRGGLRLTQRAYINDRLYQQYVSK